MLQFVVASHGDFAKEGVRAAAMICGAPPENLHILSIRDGEGGITEFEEEASRLAERLVGNPVLILSDFYGGSPFMALLSRFRDNDYQLVSGFNLPMLIELFQSADLTLGEAAGNILKIGKDVSIRLVDKIV